MAIPSTASLAATPKSTNRFRSQLKPPSATGANQPENVVVKFALDFAKICSIVRHAVVALSINVFVCVNVKSAELNLAWDQLRVADGNPPPGWVRSLGVAILLQTVCLSDLLNVTPASTRVTTVGVGWSLRIRTTSWNGFVWGDEIPQRTCSSTMRSEGLQRRWITAKGAVDTEK